MEVVYEVTLEVDLALRDEYRLWLDEHVRQMLALPGFLGAEIQEQRGAWLKQQRDQ